MERSSDEFLLGSASAVSRRAIVRRLGSGGLLAAAAAIAPASLAGAQEALTEEEGTDLADRFVGRFNASDLEGLGRLFAPDIAVHLPWPIHGSGADYLLGIYRLSKIVAPDSSIRIDDLLVAQDRIVAITTISGTQSGGLLGFPVTNAPFQFAAIFVARVAAGKIAEVWGQVDVIAAALQVANGTDAFTSLLSTLIQPAAQATPAAGAVALDDLVAVPGVAFALEFGNDGSVVNYRSSIDIPQEEIDQAAQAGPTLNSLLAVAAARYNDISVLTWDPPRWVVYSGGDRWTAVLAGNVALIAETATTDFNALAKTLGVQA
jgi:roadblock/LC7 domain-containing protein